VQCSQERKKVSKSGMLGELFPLRGLLLVFVALHKNRITHKDHKVQESQHEAQKRSNICIKGQLHDELLSSWENLLGSFIIIYRK
jgi:hypothetical protein